MSDEQRTEKPTSQRRQDARRDGRVARSRDLTVAVSLLGVFLALESWGPFLAERSLLLTRQLLAQVSAAPAILQGPGLGSLGTSLVLFLAYCSVPIALTSCGVALIAHVGQGAWVFVPHYVAPQLDRVNPLEGVRRLASAGSWIRGAFAALKLLVVGALLSQTLSSWLEIGGQAATTSTSWAMLWESLVGFGVRLSFYLVLLALLDHAVQRWLHERSLRMTREEIREEAQRQGGDQGIKDRRRRFHAVTGIQKSGEAQS
jgi:flagellar biosynthetic protein FlhB